MTEKLNAIVGAKISEFRRKMAEVKQIAKTIPNKIVVNVEARVKKFQKRMDRLANTIRTFDTVWQNVMSGGLMMISPAAIPILITIIGLLGTLGPMIGVIGGSAFALASAFAFAGTAALAFGSAAVPTISKLFGDTEKLTKAQKAARAEYEKFKSTWNGIVKDLEKPVLDAFSKSMQIANKVLQMARPLFDSAATAVNNLLNSLNQSFDSAPVKAFFDYMNTNAGPMLETLGRSFGNFMQGFMSMMTAFGPLAERTAQGFLNMSQGFAEWAAGLSKSEKFQQFVNYINENMPKIRAIFRDALAGIMYFFAAFGPLSSDMMTSLQGMVGGFKEWARALGENQSFQKFIGYIRDNAPQVIELIGNLTNFLINLGIGLAPIGAKVLEIVNNILSWTNSMMTAHPIIGQIIGVALILVGALTALAPSIIAVTTLFSGAGGIISGAFSRILSIFLPFKGSFMMGIRMMGSSIVSFLVNISKMSATFIAQLTKMLARAVVWAVRMAAQWLIAMGPIGWIILAVIALVALIIWKWDEVKKWTVKIWTATVNWIKDAWSKITSWTSESASKVYNWTREKFNSAKEAIHTAMQNARSKVQEIWSNIKSFFSTTLSNIVQTVKSKFTDFVNSVREKINDAVNKVREGWNKAQSFLESIDLHQIGKDIIQGLINGIGSMVGKVTSKIKEVAGNIKETITGWLDVHSPSRFTDWVGRMFGKGLVNGIGSMMKPVARVGTKMAQAAMITPQRTQFAYDTSFSNGDFGKINHQFNAEVSRFELPAASNSTDQSNSDTVNLERMFEGANIYVQNGYDVKSMMREAYQFVKSENRRKGNR